MIHQTFVKSVIIGFILMSIFPIRGTSNIHEVVVPSKIYEVTVYADRALVTRSGNVEVHPGEYHIVIENLPSGIREETIRVRGEGGRGIYIQGVEVRRVFLDAVPEERIRELNERIDDLNVKNEIISAELSSLEAERLFIESIKIHKSDEIGRELKNNKVSIDEWRITAEFIRSSMEKNLKTSIEKRVEQNKIQRELDKLKREVGAMSGARQMEVRHAIVRVTSEISGSFRFYLSYLIPGVSWTPAYEVRTGSDPGEIDLYYYGLVSQRSGEDWGDSRIILSTARPAVGARMPGIRPWYIRPIIPPRTAAPREEMFLEDAEVMAKAAPAPPAIIEEHATTFTYQLPGSHTVPGDGSSQRLFIEQYRLTGEKEYMTTPKSSPFAYLKVSVVNHTPTQLLAGNINIYLRGDYIGRSQIPLVRKGEEFDLFLGIDESIRVERTELSRETDEGRRRKTVELAYGIEVENFRREPITISVIDNIPVSQHTDIEVRVVEINPEPEIMQEDGMMKWSFIIPPGNTQNIRYSFWIRHPIDMNVSGY